MPRTRVFPLAAALLAMVLPVAANADDLDTVVQRAQAAWEKHKTMTATISMTSNVQTASSVISGYGSGRLECLRKGDKTLFRSDSTITFTRIQGDKQDSQQKQELHSVSDGELTYVLTTVMGRTQAMKIPADPRTDVTPKVLIDALKNEGEITLLPNEKLGDHDVYVMEVVLSHPAPRGVARRVLRIDQEHGLLRQMIAYDGQGNPMSTMTYSEFKFDVDLNPKRFEFHVPAGVQLIDRSKH